MGLKLEIIFVILSVTGVYGYYYFDLFNIMNMHPLKPNYGDVSMTEGPVVRGSKTKGLLFGKKTGEIKYEGDYFAYLANTITTSPDFTFYTWLKITEKPTKDKNTWTFFTLRPQSTAEDIFFSIGIVYKGTNDAIEGQETNLDKIQQNVIINQATLKDRSTHPTFVPLKNKLKFNEWQLLMVRIRGAQYSVRIDCEEIGAGTLTQGKIEEFPYGGILTFSQGIAEDYLTDVVPVNRFVGGLHEPTIINGESAFLFFSPCDADFSIQDIPTEPLPHEYNPERFDKYVEMTTENVEAIRISCKGSDKKTHYSGTTWKVGYCTKEECDNGVLKERYTCKFCSEGDKNYMDRQKWFNPSVPCEENTCNGRQYKPEVNKKTVTCPTLNCDTFGNRGDPAIRGVCCDECWRDTCTADRQYDLGCERPCNGGIDFVCAKKERGCWCKSGYALNDKGKCIPSSDCKCKSGTKTYLPGQAAVRSPCETCICSHGSMICFASCII